VYLPHSSIKTKTLCLEKARSSTPYSSAYSDQKLRCWGRACTNCGRCRDWYWSPHARKGKDYTKRNDAHCTADFDPRFRYWHGDFLYDGGLFGDGYVCECDDNRSPFEETKV